MQSGSLGVGGDALKARPGLGLDQVVRSMEKHDGQVHLRNFVGGIQPGRFEEMQFRPGKIVGLRGHGAGDILIGGGLFAGGVNPFEGVGCRRVILEARGRSGPGPDDRPWIWDLSPPRDSNRLMRRATGPLRKAAP